MKICPQCQSTYTDDSLQYCLQDGTPLDEYSSGSDSWASAPTLVTPGTKDRIRVELPSPLAPAPPAAQNQPAQTPPVQPPPQKSNTLAVVLATAFGVLLLVGIGGAAAWFYFKNSQPTVANTNAKPVNSKTPVQRNENQTANVNANATASPTATATPKPTLRPEEASKIETNVADTIENWRTATETADLDAQMNNYAATVDYYNAGGIGASRVRSDKERAFGVYHTIDISISDIKVKPDADGEKAIAVFDKEWNFEGDEKYSSGKVQQQLEFQKINGRWLITGEKDLKVYYVNK